ncbi:MAG TPA: protein translocase subunit SecD [Candidatus Gracilibacteria bacterium]|mgnify:CR=1 FL=1|nr:protein translocase subunit SecD [Candidatus Gracilibacteria bacterium]
MSNRSKLITIGVFCLFIGFFAMPQSWKSKLPNSAIKEFLLKQSFHLGLDLQGGTQLDYLIDLRNAEKLNNDKDEKNDVNIKQIIEGVRTTLERRVNGLGVSEPNIYTSNVGGENHVIVELAGILDEEKIDDKGNKILVKGVDKAKEIVGKTIQLEFKEPKTTLDPNEKENIKKEGEKVLEEAKSTEDFAKLGTKVKTDDQKIAYEKVEQFKDEINETYREQLWNAPTNTLIPALIEANEGYTVNEYQQISEKTGYVILKSGSKSQVEREKTVDGKDFAETAKTYTEKFEDKEVKLDYFPIETRKAISELKAKEITKPIELANKWIIFKLTEKKGEKDEIRASHILVSYKGAERSEQTRTKEEAEKLAKELKAQVNASNFSAIAKEKSDDPVALLGGDLGFFGKGKMTPNFEKAAFDLKVGEISDIVETTFGYHIIYKTGDEPVYSTEKISIAKTEADAKNKIQKIYDEVSPKKVKGKEDKLSYEKIFFSTLPDAWQSTGLDGSKFVRASVSFDQMGKPLVAITFNPEGSKLFEDLTGRNIGKPIAIFVGGNLISAPNVNDKITGGSAQITGRFTIPEAAKLAQDLNTGAISAPITLVGQNQVNATLGVDALHKSVMAGGIGIIAIFILMLIRYGFMGFISCITLSIYAMIMVFILKSSGLLGMPIILTLAGATGIILSIGVAIDANILIFERIREELKSGKKMPAAISIGFDRAWTSIRDSNLSGIITCIVLAWFGSSIIRGFAINLAIGTLMSMLTAVVITRVIIFSIMLGRNK